VRDELGAWALREEGQDTIDQFLTQVKDERILSSSGLSKARAHVNGWMQNPSVPKSDLVSELEVKIQNLSECN